MSTRGRIGLELSDGSILSVYHHFDSYPEWLGNTLKEHYNTYETVADLIDGGDMSVCWTQERFLKDSTKTSVEKFGPQYYSERGENCPPRLDDNWGAYANQEIGEEYHYIFTRKGEWVCIDMHQYELGDPSPNVVPISARGVSA
jgi:hypothetical protein